MTTATARRNQRLRRHAERIRAEGQGVWQIAIYSDFAAVIDVAAMGSGTEQQRARQVLDIVYQLSAAIVNAPVDTPMLCLTCDTAFDLNTLRETVVLVHAWRDDADRALVHGLCPACCRRWNQSDSPLAERETAVTDTLRRLLLSDLKRLPVVSSPGHA